MIKCLIIEDQLPARQILQKYISDAGHLELVEIFSNALDALEYLHDHKVDLIFLDIHLPRLSGIDFLAVLKDQPYVILTTAFPDYALHGYELDVVDYLLKPFSFKRFLNAVKKVERLMKKVSASAESIKAGSILVKVGYDMVRIKLDEITHIQADGDYTNIFCRNKKYYVSHSLKYWSDTLPEEQFLQVHRSYVVNIFEVKKASSNDVVVNNVIIPLGRVYKKKFHDAFLRVGHSS